MTMTNWIDRLKEDDEGQRILEQERVILEITEAIAVLMKEEEVTRSELARRIGKSPAYITKILRGSNNFTLRTISDIFFALGRSAHISLAPLGDQIQVPQTNDPSPKEEVRAGAMRRTG